jgi:hypothetical protein
LLIPTLLTGFPGITTPKIIWNPISFSQALLLGGNATYFVKFLFCLSLQNSASVACNSSTLWELIAVWSCVTLYLTVISLIFLKTMKTGRSCSRPFCTHVQRTWITIDACDWNC